MRTSTANGHRRRRIWRRSGGGVEPDGRHLRHLGRLGRLRLLLGLLVVAWPVALAAQFWPPGYLNPAAVDDGTATDFDVDQVIGPDGTIHAVFTSSYDYSGVADADPDVWYVRNSGTGWTAPLLVNRYGGGDTSWEHHPKIAIAEDGTLYCVWDTDYTPGGPGPDLDVLFAELVPGAPEWSSPETVTDNYDDDHFPWVVAGPQGRPMVIWEGFGQGEFDVKWSERTASGWSPPAVLSDYVTSESDSDAYSLEVSSHPEAKTVTASWLTTYGNYIARFFYNGQWGWSFPYNLESNQWWPRGLSHNPDVAVVKDDNGHLLFHLVFAASNQGDYEVYHALAFDWIANLIGPPTVVNTDAATDSFDDTEPNVCLEPSGALHVVWRRKIGSQDSDVLYAATSNPSDRPPQFSPPVTIGGQGDLDSPGEYDDYPVIACARDGWISAMWDSTDDLGGTIGGDWDILHSLGLGRLFEAPEPLRDDWKIDDATEDEITPAIAPMASSLVAVYSRYSTDVINGSHWLLWSERYVPEGDYWARIGVVGGCCFGDMLDPALATGPTGMPDLVFVSRLALYGGDLDVFHSRFDGENWSEPSLVAPLGQSTDGALDDDRRPSVAVTSDDTVYVAFAEQASDRVVVYEQSPGMQWIETSIPGNYVEPALYSAVSLVAAGGELQLAFVATDRSQAPWVFWSRRDPGSGWASAEPVGPASLTAAGAPVLVPQGAGAATLVWISDSDTGGQGTDNDLLTSRRSRGGWSPPVPLLLLQYFDGADDHSLVGATSGDRLHLAWISDLDLGNTAGTDPDVLYADVELDATPPTLPPMVLADPMGHVDAYADSMPAITVDDGGNVWVAWVSPDPQATVPDLDPWTSRRPLGGSLLGELFADGFELGTTGSWSAVEP